MSDFDALKKDWITMLVATSGTLLTIVAAAMGAYHAAVQGRHWQLMVVDAIAVTAIVCFLLAVLRGLKALGSLILAATAAADQSQREKAAEEARLKADRAQRWFKRGLALAVATAAAAAVALNWIG